VVALEVMVVVVAAVEEGLPDLHNQQPTITIDKRDEVLNVC
jgi:hypothetical protein